MTGKKLIGVRWVDVEKGFGVHRSRLVANDFRPKSSVKNTEGVYAARPPLELVKFLFSNAAASSRRDMFAMSCSSTSGKRTCILRLRWSKTLTHLPHEPIWKNARHFSSRSMDCGLQQAAGRREYMRTMEEVGVCDGSGDYVHEKKISRWWYTVTHSSSGCGVRIEMG